MSTEHNKQIAREFFERLDRRDIDGAVAMLSEDATYWIAGRRETIPSAGTQTKPQIARIFRLMDEQIEGGLRLRVTGAIAEGDQVALLMESHGRLRNGRVYENSYHIHVTVRDERIAAIREYLDTQHVFDVWFRREGAAH